MNASPDRIYRKLFCCGGHGVHSPFVFNLITDVIEEKKHYYCYESLHAVRLQLLQNRQQVVCHADNTYMVDRFLHKYGFAKREDELLFRLANRFKPATIVVAGSGLGLTPLYLTAYSKEAHCIVFEPELSIATMASAVVEKYAIAPITIYEQSLRTVAADTLNGRNIDVMVWGRSFVNDGRNDWMDTFERVLPLMHDKSVFVVSDIHISRENREFWQAVCIHPKVTVTLDLYSLGIVILNPKLHRKTYKSIV